MSFIAPVREDWPSRLPMPDWVAWGVLASLLLHVILLAAALWWPRRLTVVPPPEESVAVDFVTPEQFQAATRASPAALQPHTPEAGAPAVPAPPEAGAPAVSAPPAGPPMIHATTMLSALALADPKSSQARQVLPRLAPEERGVQLCDLEAMEQVHAWKAEFNPERIIAYATAEVAIAGDAIKADGAAFFSAGRWYDLRFACTLAADHASVVAFDFHVGDPIPRDQWNADNLPTAK